MTDLRTRFGRLTAAHRRRCGLTQEQLAEAAEVSVDMISKIEIGKTGVSFSLVERLAAALGIDTAELFTTELPNSTLRNGPFLELSERLAMLDPADLEWVSGVIEAALKARR